MPPLGGIFYRGKYGRKRINTLLDSAGGRMGRTSSYCKQTLVALLVYVLALTPTFVFAAGKNYNVKTITYDPLERVINATILDQIAEKTMRRSAKVPVTASATGSTVASMIRMGIAGAAIYGLIEGVGWIIENGVVKKPKNSEEGQKNYVADNVYGATAESVAEKYCYALYPNSKYRWQGEWGFYGSTTTQVRSFGCYEGERQRVVTLVYKLNQTTEIKEYVPVSETELGDKVNNSPQAPDILPTVYNPNNPAGGKAPQDTSDALDRAVPVPETDPTGSTEVNPETGKGTFKLPAFCEWASVMCAWYQKYQEDSKKTDQHREQEKDVWSQEKTARDEEKTARQQEEAQREKERNFWQKVEDWFKKWDDTPEQNDDTEVDVDQPENQNIDTTINFGGACPQPISVPYSFAGATGTIEFSYEPLCQIASFIKPVVITVASFSAALIIGGIRTEDS